MRRTTPAAVVIAAALAATSTALSGTAGAVPASRSAARQYWQRGAQVAAAVQARQWDAARRHLPTHDVHERHDLAALAAIPLTDTTAEQRATAARVTRELNGFFRTPGLYGVAADNPEKIAEVDWIKSAQVAAARQSVWLGAAYDELASYGARDHAARADLVSLESIPLTSTSAAQRATARHDYRALDAFFGTPGIGS